MIPGNRRYDENEFLKGINMKTKHEIYLDKEFAKWFDENGFHVSHFAGVEPIYMNHNDPGDTVDIGQRCYTIEEIYELYEESKVKTNEL